MRRRAFFEAVVAVAVLVDPLIPIRAEDDPKTRRLKSALDSPVSLECKDDTLEEVMSLVSELHNITVTIDKDALKSIGISEKTKLTYKAEGVRLKDAMNHMLATVHKDLIYEIKDGELLVTVKKKEPPQK